MSTVTLPKDMENRMESFPEVNWSAVLRKAVEERLEKLAFLKHFASESELSEAESVKLGKELKKRLAERYRGG